jgi:hypothetical protein
VRRRRWRAVRLTAWLAVGVSAVSSNPIRAEGNTNAVPLSAAPPPGHFSIRWTRPRGDSNRAVIEVIGLSRQSLDGLRRAGWTSSQWQRLLSVYAGQEDPIADLGLPPMSGVYRVDSTSLRFEPQFPLDPGVRYRAVFRPDQLPGKREEGESVTADFQIPARPSTPTTVVRQIYPSAQLLPENLLKFYVYFSAPMSRGHIYDHIHLKDNAARAVELPFLEIDEELWNPEMTRLTLFIDPGRIKRGVRPLEEIGPALEAGKGYSLVIDPDWRDGAGNPLKESFQKSFKVGPPDRDPPDPATWKIEPPRRGTRDALAVSFPEPMDQALARRMIRVTRASGEPVEGEPALDEEERRWTFVPARPWRRGPYRLVIQTTIEDLAGNNIGKPFDVDLFESVQRRVVNSSVTLPFEI